MGDLPHWSLRAPVHGKPLFIATPICHCDSDLSLRTPLVIADSIRNPVFAWHWIPGQARDDNFSSLRTPLVIADSIRNPVFACHWIPGQARDDNFLRPGMTTFLVVADSQRSSGVHDGNIRR